MEVTTANTYFAAPQPMIPQDSVLFGLLNNSLMVAFMKDEDGVITYVNDTFVSYFAAGRELVGKHESCVVPDEYFAAIRENDLKVLNSNQAHEFIEEVPTPDGNVMRWLVVKFPYVDSNGKRHIGGIATDYSERDRIRRELEQAKYEYKTILDAVPAFVCYKDCENRVLRANAYTSLNLGLPIEEIEGRSLFELLPQDAAKLYAQDLEVIKSGKPMLGLLQSIVSPMSGETKWLNLDKIPHRNEHGEIVGVVIVAKDITEQKLLNDQKEDLVAAVAHDLKVPVIGTYRALEVMLDGLLGPLNSKQQEFIRKVMHSNERLLDFIQNLIDAHSYATRESKIIPECLNFTSTINGCLQQLDILILEKKLNIKKEYSDIVRVKADKSALWRLVMNLLSNAVKFTPPEGHITISLESQETIAGKAIVFKVANSGISIHPDDQKLLFQRFWRGKESGKYLSGTGLGLYLCKQIVDAMDGTITCRSAIGEPTQFIVTLPIP